VVARDASVLQSRWWEGAVLYQVYIRSFADGNGDGVGDLIGLRSRLPYLASLGVDGIWITPFFPSPMVDGGYDVSDPRGVDPLFGTLDDFDAVVADAHRLGLGVIIDVIPNHTSDQHPWFQAALSAAPGSPERARYLFSDEPNNWNSVFGGSAWKQVEGPEKQGGQFYLHLFAPEQPDLNWRNPEVQADAEATLRFWLDRGVDGFRIDVAHGLFKDAEFTDNPRREGPGIKSFAGMEQRYTFDQPEVHGVYRRWRALAESHPSNPVLLGEVFLWDQDRVAAYVRDGELHLAFSFLLLGQKWEPENLRRAVDMTRASLGSRAAWALSNHDLPRHATRFGSVRRARAGALLLLALPGTAVLYQGEELGLENAPVPESARRDVMEPSRDPCRVPLPWTSDGPGCGWTSPWLPVPPSWAAVSVEAQSGDDESVLALYRRALTLRPSVFAGQDDGFEWLDSFGPSCLAFRRGDAACVVNAGAGPVELTALAGGEVALASSPLADAAVLPPDTAVWLRLRP
jgi:alpha-glucosidase